MRFSSLISSASLCAPALAIVGLAVLPQSDPPTFSKDVAPLVYARCVPCHRPGGFAPFSLVSYEDVAKRSELIRRVTINRQMPPTDGLSDHATVPLFAKLNDAELRMIQEWVRAGSPEGSPAAVPPVPTFDDKWSLGEPDLVLELERPTPVRAAGNPYWRAYFVQLPPDMSRKGLIALDVRPRSPKAVRHVLLAQDPNAKSTFAGYGFSTSGTLNVAGKHLVGAWAPGYRPLRLPEKTVLPLQPLPLLVQVHYAPTGKEEEGQIEIALYFGKGSECRNASWLTLGRDDFVIEPDQSLELSDSIVLDQSIQIIAVHPEARMFADQVNLSEVLPESRPSTVLQIYAWRIDWIGSYVFDNPVRVKKGSRLTAKVAYDNGRHAPANEGREQPGLVTSGPTLMDEIFKVHVLFVTDD